MTEFSWDTNPPDPKGVPVKLHARWVSEALYRMWRAGVSTVIWFRLQDDPLRVSPYQSGFFTTSGQAKYSLEAFRFPFVAFEQEGGVSIWGRTPSGKPGPVIVERMTGNSWITAARSVPTATAFFRPGWSPAWRNNCLPRETCLRRRTVDPVLATVPPPRPVAPFGCGGTIPCSRG